MAQHPQLKKLIAVPNVRVVGRLVKATGQNTSDTNLAMDTWKRLNSWVHTHYDHPASSAENGSLYATCAIDEDDMALIDWSLPAAPGKDES